MNKNFQRAKGMYVKGGPKTWNFFGVVFIEATHAYLKMIPFEALHGRNCNTQINWDNRIKRVMIRP